MKIELSISPENQIEENRVFEKICECISNKKSFIFDAGAGAGKTYELMQTLKYIVNKYGFLLNKHNQKILCITYTNVAVEEIKNRLGNSRLVKVSTIHDCLWDIISSYQEQLVIIHLDNLKSQVDKINNDLSSESWATAYCNLSSYNKDLLFTKIYDNKTFYYQHYADNAQSFRSAMQELIGGSDFSVILANVNNFKKIVNYLLKKSRYEQAVIKITAKETKYQSLEYDSRRNVDRLESMKISHDTLLNYAEKIVEQNKPLRRFIADKYPYVLVDEYQDTNEKVIKLLKDIYDFSDEKNRDFFLAFFGDAKQNIYEDGIGNKISKYVSDFERIIKIFNRRSASEIISISNKIRADDIEQKTIYSNFPKANIYFYNVIDESQFDIVKDELISKFRQEWSIGDDNKLHCFELRNELVAKRSNFFDIYQFFHNSKFYRTGQNYKYLSQHVLSLDSKKRGEIQNTLLQVLDFRAKITADETSLSEIISKDVSRQINLNILRKLVRKFKTISGNTLTEYLTNTFNLYKKGDKIYDACINNIFGDFTSLEKYEQFILNELFSHDEEVADAQKQTDTTNMKEFFNLPISIFESWYDYLNGKSTKDTIFHTFHSTKGLEFDNVLIFFESNFARNANYFNNLFRTLDNGNVEVNDDVEKARNLLYVALTRAKHNLSILYLNDLGTNKEIIEKIFGEINAI